LQSCRQLRTVPEEREEGGLLRWAGGKGLKAALLVHALNPRHALHAAAGEVVHVEELAPPRRHHLWQAMQECVWHLHRDQRVMQRRAVEQKSASWMKANASAWLC
jgi:hypothetical protein